MLMTADDGRKPARRDGRGGQEGPLAARRVSGGEDGRGHEAQLQGGKEHFQVSLRADTWGKRGGVGGQRLFSRVNTACTIVSIKLL